MNKQEFLKKCNLTEDQFCGKVEISGSLYLGSLTSIPEGFNPTVGGSLYLNSQEKYIGLEVDTNFLWNRNGKRYAIIDSIFCEILSEKNNGYKIFKARKIAKTETFYIITNGKFWAHGDDLKQAHRDLDFKVRVESLRKEPITKETIITIEYYRIITGACEMGCKSWMDQNNITQQEIKAGDLLPILEKTHAYGFDKFKQLMIA